MVLETEVARTGTQALGGFLRCGTLVTDPFFRSRFIDEASSFVESLQTLNVKNGRKSLAKALRPLESLLDEVSYVGLCSPLATQQAKKELWQWAFERIRPVQKKAPPKPVNHSKPKELESGKVINYDQAVIEYLSKSPRSRTKEIVFGLKKISPRTVKRSLHRLTKRGVIHKQIEGKFVWYSIGG